MLNDWGTSYYCARELGDRAFSLVDLGHHGPNVNVEMIVARLIQFGKLGGFHFNDSQYGDDDLDAGSVKPFQLFLIFNELVDAERSGVPGFSPAYMLDQSHNVTDPIESLIASSIELSRAYVQAHLVDRDALAAYQEANDPLMALQTLKQAYTTDVAPSSRRRGCARAARSIRSRRIGRAATAGRWRSGARPTRVRARGLSDDSKSVPHVGAQGTGRGIRAPPQSDLAGAGRHARRARRDATIRSFSTGRPATCSRMPRSKAKSDGTRSPRPRSAGAGGGTCAT